MSQCLCPRSPYYIVHQNHWTTGAFTRDSKVPRLSTSLQPDCVFTSPSREGAGGQAPHHPATQLLHQGLIAMTSLEASTDAYLQLKRVDKLDEFIMTDKNLNFDLETAIKVLLSPCTCNCLSSCLGVSAGWLLHARSLSGKEILTARLVSACICPNSISSWSIGTSRSSSRMSKTSEQR